jgi:methyl-accepting chemotaxis protein
MDLTLLALPQAQERVNEILFTLMKMSTDEKVRAEEKTTLKILTNKLRTVDLDRVIASANTALNEDENFFGVSQSLQSNFTQPLNEVSTFLTRFATLTDSIADGEAATDDVVAIAEAASQAQSGLIKFWHVGSKELDELLSARVAHQERNFILAVSLSLLCIVGSGILSVFITRRLTAPFIVAVTRLKKEATTTKLASHNLSHAAQGLSVSSVQQSEAIHETVAASAQMSSMVSQTAHHANEASRNAAEVSLMTKEGGNIMRQMVDSMETIQHATSQLVDVQKIIDEISAKTDIINDIVFKTQLLSFNASIEAARAGQHGLGFAVVAEEVGNLAQLSGNAATEIEVLLQNSRRKVSDIVEQMHVRVKDGNIVSTEALEKFNEIAARISTISEQAENIRQATNEQEKGIRQTSKAMEQMNKMLEQNAHVAKKTAHSSDDLKAQSQKLDKIGRRSSLRQEFVKYQNKYV